MDDQIEPLKIFIFDYTVINHGTRGTEKTWIRPFQSLGSFSIDIKQNKFPYQSPRESQFHYSFFINETLKSPKQFHIYWLYGNPELDYVFKKRLKQCGSSITQFIQFCQLRVIYQHQRLHNIQFFIPFLI